MRFIAWPADVDAVAILISAGVLVVIVLLGAVAVMFARRRMKGDDGDIADVPAAGFTLGDLKRMHEAGQISSAEFERARNKVVAATKLAAEKMAAAKKPPAAIRGENFSPQRRRERREDIK